MRRLVVPDGIRRMLLGADVDHAAVAKPEVRTRAEALFMKVHAQHVARPEAEKLLFGGCLCQTTINGNQWGRSKLKMAAACP
ncbi:MAG: hypothetical protein JWO19_2245 [Bryobacterales bacterium]|nr:hypothetical protein [Bryobacterales bacterium]